MIRILLLIFLASAPICAQVSEVHWHPAGAGGSRYEAWVEPSLAPLQLLIRTTAYSDELLADGKPLGRTKHTGSDVLDLPAQKGLTLTLIMANTRLPLAAWTGTPPAIATRRALLSGERLRDTQPARFLCTALLTGGLFFLIIPLWRPKSAEYFWCGLYFIMGGFVRAFGFFPEAFGITELATALQFINLAAVIQVGIAWPAFCVSLLRRRPGWLSCTVIAAVLAVSVWVSVWGSVWGYIWVGVVVRNVAQPLIYFDTVRRRNNAEKLGLLHWALGLFMSASILSAVLGFRGAGPHTNTLLPLALSYSILAFMFAMALIMNRRSAVSDREQVRLKQELMAAAEVQALLLPHQQLRGVEAVYWPAQEVGGDFYWTRSNRDGSLLVAVGDVSGKGLKAAMLVSVAVGILRNEKSVSPAAVLGALNEGLAGHTGGGFVTCCCARFDPDGTASLANAGHPAPYADGQEIEVEAGLPLGIAPGVIYGESVVSGKRFTFVSDGVVEAENAKRELFGFDRTRAISGKSANEIAEAAKAWGQNDDITVVTVRREECQ